eukprot:478395-Pleurochrysis_carterae.AAC.1
MGSSSVATCSFPSAHSWPMRTRRFPSRVWPEDITLLYDSSYFSLSLGVSTKRSVLQPCIALDAQFLQPMNYLFGQISLINGLRIIESIIIATLPTLAWW